MKVELGKTAVLVIDVQNDYCSPDGYWAKNIGFDISPMTETVPKIKKFVEKSRKKGMPIIFTKMTEHQDHVPENMKKKMEKTHGDFFAKPGSWGHDFFEVQPDEKDTVLEKNQYDAFTNSELEKVLREKGIENLIVCGFTTGVCVDTTVRSAFSKGFNIVVAEDLVATAKQKQEQHKASLSVLGFNFADVEKSEDILEERYEK